MSPTTDPTVMRVESDDWSLAWGTRVILYPEDSTTAINLPVHYTRNDLGPDSTVTVVVDLDPAGRLGARRLVVDAVEGGASVTADLLRRVHVADLVREAVTRASRQVLTDADGNLVIPALPSGFPHTDATPAETGTVNALTTRRKSSSRDPLPDEHLREVAKVYRQAVKEKRSTRNAIITHFQTSPATAAWWVMEARKRTDAKGKPFLGPAVGRKAGEA